MKSTVSFLCFLMILFSSAYFMDGHAAETHTSSCTDYLTSYLSAVEAFNSANETLQRVNVAVAKATGINVPPEYTHLENEYDSDPTGFYQTIQGMGVALPGYISGPLLLQQIIGLNRAKIEAQTTYNTADAALDRATNYLQDCQGTTIITIWCERGADCQNPPELS